MLFVWSWPCRSYHLHNVPHSVCGQTPLCGDVVRQELDLSVLIWAICGGGRVLLVWSRHSIPG